MGLKQFQFRYVRSQWPTSGPNLLPQTCHTSVCLGTLWWKLRKSTVSNLQCAVISKSETRIHTQNFMKFLFFSRDYSFKQEYIIIHPIPNLLYSCFGTNNWPTKAKRTAETVTADKLLKPAQEAARLLACSNRSRENSC
jgi:hypothetical protein